jgi:hypothetical protein
MVDKIAGLARLVATLLAIVAGFIALPNVNVALVLVVLGIVAGLGYAADQAVRLFVVVLVLPAVGTALATIPAVGAQLNAVALNIAMAAAGIAATVIAMRLYNNSKDDITRLAGSGDAKAAKAASA